MSILNELMIFMQPGFLQQYAEAELSQEERDIFRAKLFRERLQCRSVHQLRQKKIRRVSMYFAHDLSFQYS